VIKARGAIELVTAAAKYEHVGCPSAIPSDLEEATDIMGADRPLETMKYEQSRAIGGRRQSQELNEVVIRRLPPLDTRWQGG
jgi:hypothetical protein